MVVMSNTTPMWTNIFTYDTASRLTNVSDSANSATYSYLANSPLVSQITFKQSGTTRMTTTKQYDYLNRLTSIGTTNSSSVTISSSAYGYNSANQRTSMTNEDGSYWLYGYDTLGQVIAANRYWSDGTPVAGEQFGNAFDNIGNRTSSQAGGNANGTALHTALFTVNDLNQYTSQTAPGFFDVLGTATNSATVTVNGQLAYRHGSFFETELPVQNGGVPIWQSVTTQGVLGGTNDTVSNVTGNVFLPANPEKFFYDRDGNTIADGRFTNTWDAENRLIGMTNIANIATTGKYALSFAYDWMSRRTQKIVYTNSGTSWVASYTNKFIYDGWNVVAVLDGGDNFIRSFVWGSDLSGSMQGACGVGGMISTTIYGGSHPGTYFSGFDGNGNVTALVSASDGSIAELYWHSPFGEMLGMSGRLGSDNCILFSTKWYDWESSRYYYGYRYLRPGQDWLSRDPILEAGFASEIIDPEAGEDGPNLYSFVDNSPVFSYDPDGRLVQYGSGATLSITYEQGVSLPCGGWLNFWNYDGSVDNSYWLLQEVTVRWPYYDCNNSRRVNAHDLWYEGILVTKGSYHLSDKDYSAPNRHAYSTGTESVTVQTKFVRAASKYGKAVAAWGHQVMGAGDMNSTYTPPSWWPKVAAVGGRNTWVDSWACCCPLKVNDGTMRHSP